MTVRLISGGSSSHLGSAEPLTPTRRLFSPLETGFMAALIAVVLILTMTDASAHLSRLSFVSNPPASTSR